MAKAAVTRSIRDDHQKNFLKIFNGLTGKHSRWEIWEDFVTLTAIEMADITYIPIRQLHPHPDNPRKELGDLSELSASIKENGVYQNLTVIPGHYLSSREYISKCVDEGGDAAAAAAAWTPTGDLRALWFFLIPALSGVKYHEDDGGGKK